MYSRPNNNIVYKWGWLIIYCLMQINTVDPCGFQRAGSWLGNLNEKWRRPRKCVPTIFTKKTLQVFLKNAKDVNYKFQPLVTWSNNRLMRTRSDRRTNTQSATQYTSQSTSVGWRPEESQVFCLIRQETAQDVRLQLPSCMDCLQQGKTFKS